MKAQFELGALSSETLSAAKFVHKEAIRSEEDIISAQEANELFPVDVPYSEPVSARAAGVIQAHQDDKKRLANIIANGEGGWIESFSGFAASVAGAAIDPIGILSGKALTGVGGSVLNKAIGKGLTGKVSREILETSIEGAIGNVATEALLVAPLSIADQEDINVTRDLVFAATAGAAFPAVTGAIGAAYKGFKNLSLDKVNKAVDITEARMDADLNPNLTATEIELLSREKYETLNTEYAELETRYKNGDDVEAELHQKADEIDQYMDEFSDEKAIRESSNNEGNKIYNDPETNKKIEGLDAEEDVNVQEMAQREFDELDDESLEFIKDEIEPYNQAEAQLDTLTKAIHFCVTG